MDCKTSMAKGGFVGKGEMVWKKMTSSQKADFLYKNFTPEITPASQHQLSNKTFQFLPQKVKIAFNAKYANVDTTEMAKGGNLRAIAKKYEENEDENMHSENVVLLAKHFGTPEELKQAKQILATHEKEGSLSTENGGKRRKLSLKLIAKAREQMAKEGISFAKGGTAASIDYKDYIGRKMDEYRRSMGGTYEDFVHYALRDLGLENQGKIDKKKMDSVISEVSAKNPRFKKAWLSFKKDSEMYVKGGDYVNPYQETYKKGGIMNKAWSRKIDKSMKAKKAGWRKSAESGEYYYEDRPNRSDKDRKTKLAKGGSVSTSELNDLIEKINTESGANFSLRGAYGNYELWAKTAKGENRIEVGSRKDIKEALIKNRYNSKYTKYAHGGMTEHGLKTGDSLGNSSGNTVIVYPHNKSEHSPKVVNLNVGKRMDGPTYASMSKKDRDKYTNMGKGGYMKKGGKAKEQDPPIVRGYADDEPYEYGKGGSTGCWCYDVGGL